MEDSRLAWLVACAEKLESVGVSRRRVNVRLLCSKLGIPLHKRVQDSARKGAGVLEVRPQQGYSIVLIRDHEQPARLSRRERFTIAHEIAHLLLIRKYSWNPHAGHEYYLCEDYCDHFAGALLLPRSYLQLFEGRSGRDLFSFVSTCYDEMEVSYEVIARRMAQEFDGLAVFAGELARNREGRTVIRVTWGAGSLSAVKVVAMKHLNCDDELGRVLLENWEQFSSYSGYNHAGTMNVFGRRLSKNPLTSLFCVVEPSVSRLSDTKKPPKLLAACAGRSDHLSN